MEHAQLCEVHFNAYAWLSMESIEHPHSPDSAKHVAPLTAPTTLMMPVACE
jgi:hypothetical protein